MLLTTVCICLDVRIYYALYGICIIVYRMTPESDHGEEYLNPIDSISTKDSISSRSKISRQLASSDDYYNCRDSAQQNR